MEITCWINRVHKKFTKDKVHTEKGLFWPKVHKLTLLVICCLCVNLHGEPENSSQKKFTDFFSISKKEWW